jgi:SAM-dependent methyltransferase
MDDAEAFFDAHAELYDRIYAERDLADTDFYVDRGRAADGPVLEVACGTGRVYLDLLRAGVDAYGIDVSEAMLSVLRETADRAGLTPSVRRADMTGFEPRREYAAVFVPFRSFLHNVALADRIAALERFRAALAPDGELVFNVFTPSFEHVCETYGEVQATTFEVDGEEYREETVSTMADEVEQVASLARTVYGPDGAVVAESETPLAFVPKSEFELLFDRVGFSEYEVYGGFDLDPLETADQEMVWIARP